MFFTLCYVVFSIIVIFPPIEFTNAGFTVENLFHFWLKSERDNFVQFQIRKTALNVLTYATLPVFYALKVAHSLNFVVNIYCYLSLIPFIITLSWVYYWSLNDWSNHPIVQQLKAMASDQLTYRDIAKNISEEIKNVGNNLVIQTSHNFVKIIVTDSWVLKCTPTHVYISNQSKSVFIASKSDIHSRSYDNQQSIQFITIDVRSTQRIFQPFSIRMNSVAFQTFKDKVNSVVAILPPVVFQKTVEEEFITVFLCEIQKNPKYETRDHLEFCIGCTQTVANVKLQKLCSNQDGVEDSREMCVTCRCKPLWCTECIAKWFTYRQAQNDPQGWLDATCTCPLCRSVFCVHDVCLVKKVS